MILLLVLVNLYKICNYKEPFTGIILVSNSMPRTTLPVKIEWLKHRYY